MREQALVIINSIIRILMTKGIILCIGLVNSVFLARILMSNGQGQYSLAVTTYSTLFQIANLGVHSAHTYYQAKDKSKSDVVWGNSLAISAITAFICAIIILFIHCSTISFPLPDSLLAVSFAIVPVYLYFYLQYQMFVVFDEVKYLNILDILAAFLPLLFNVLLFEVRGLVVEDAMRGVFISYLLVDILGIMIIRKHIQISPKISLSFYLKCIKLGIIAFFACFLGFLVLKVDQYMINSILGDYETGYYSIAVNLVEIINMICSTCTMVLFPKVVEIVDIARRRAFILNIFRTMSGIMIALMALGELVGGRVIPFIYGKQYLQSVGVFRVLLIAIVFWGLAGIPILFFTTEKKYGIIIVSYSLGIIINLGLNIVLIPSIGIMGAAFASMISYIIIFLIVYVSFLKA